jgi:flagellar biosynthesis/type III secretory pathway protein FliH
MAADPKTGARREKKPADGAGRVLRAEDWSASPRKGMAAFSYTSFNVPGRAGNETAEEDGKSAALIARLKQGEEKALQALAAERKARAEAEILRHAEGMELGRQEGEAAARAHFEKELQELQAGVESVLQTVAQEKSAAFLEFESQAAGILSFALRRVIGSLADGLPEAVLPLIQEALRSLGKSASILVKVHPGDHQVASENRSFWQHLDVDGDVRCVADERVPKGGCVVVADSTTARIDLNALGGRLADAVETACAERRRALTEKSNRPSVPNPSSESGTGSSPPPEEGGA